MAERKKKTYRIFYKLLGDPVTAKTSHIEEVKKRKFSEAVDHAIKKSKKLGCRVAGVFEVTT